MNREKYIKKIGLVCIVASAIIFLHFVSDAPLSFDTFKAKNANADAGWYNSSWQFRRRIIINSGQVATTTTVGIANFPTLISLSDLTLTNSTKADCTDVLFTQADGTSKLAHEVESCNKTTGEFNAWVNTALSSTTDTVMYMYYGGYGDQQNVSGTWDNVYKGVWHMSENPSIVTDGFCRGRQYTNCDSTSNKNHASSTGAMATANQLGGKIAGSIDFDGSNDAIGPDSLSSLNFDAAANFTVSAWFNRDTFTTDDTVLAKKSNQTTAAGYLVWIDDATDDVRFSVADGTNSYVLDSLDTFTATGWNYFAAVWNDVSTVNTEIYINGVSGNSTKTGTQSSVGDLTNPLVFRIGGDSAVGNPFDGKLDEVRVESVARHYSDILTMYRNMNATSTFYTVGTEQVRASKVRVGTNPQAVASTWYSPSWQYRRRIIIDSSKVGTTTAVGAANFATLISFSNTSLTSLMNTNCNDVLFTQTNGTTKLAHEVESCNKTTGEFNAWVNTALSSTTDTVMYMYYGGYGDQQNGNSVWDSSTKGVWHLSEASSELSSTTPKVLDSTANNNDGIVGGLASNDSTDQVPGRIGGSIDFDGNNDVIDVKAGASLDDVFLISGGGTYEAWIYPRSVGGDIVRPRTSVGGRLDSFSSNKLRFIAAFTTSGDWRTPNNSLTLNAWNHVVIVYDGSSVNNDPVFYINGISQVVTEQTAPVGAPLDSDVNKGKWIGNKTGGSPFDGLIDEVRIEKIPRYVSDITTMYNNMNSTSTFYTLGVEEGRRSPVRLGANPGFLAASNTWYSSSWQYRKRIMINQGANGPATTTILGAANFPTLISLSDLTLTNSTKADCTDVLFTQANGITKLAHEVESCNKTTGEFNAWVNTALSSTTDTVMYMYYGGYGDQQNRANTWEKEYKGVWHLAEDPSISTDGTCRGPNGFTNCDSTANNNHASSTNDMVVGDHVNGKVGGAVHFDGTNDYLNARDIKAMNALTAITVSTWVKSADLSTEHHFIDKALCSSAFGPDQGTFELYSNGAPSASTAGFAVTISGDSSGTVSGPSATTIDGSVWHYLTGIYDGAVVQIFVDGVRENSAALTGTLSTNTKRVEMGGNCNGREFFLNGFLDEVRIEPIARHYSDILTMYRNMNATTTYYTVGVQEGKRSIVRLK